MSNGSFTTKQASEMPYKKERFQVIEFGMLNKAMFFPLSSMQEKQALYRGMFHAFRTVVSEEGFGALYRGVLVKGGQVFSSVFYIATYESVRYRLSDFKYLNLTANHRAFIAGACASAVGQTMVVPIDVVSQHLMVLRGEKASPAGKVVSLTPLHLNDAEMKTAWSRAVGVVNAIRRDYGVRGFYKGYFVSLCTFVPNSGLWWFFYNWYCEVISTVYTMVWGTESRRLPVQVVSAPLAGMTASCIVNPIDVTRLRMQVENQTFRATVLDLWRTEGLAAWKKGLSARLTQSCFFSFWLTLFYEPVKWYCLKEEYKDQIQL